MDRNVKQSRITCRADRRSQAGKLALLAAVSTAFFFQAAHADRGVADDITILAIDGSGAPISDDMSILAIDGSGAPVRDDISIFAIDGSGAPISDDISIFAIDGSGAPVSDDTSLFAIDGSGAPVSDDIRIFAIDGSGAPVRDDTSIFAIDGSGAPVSDDISIFAIDGSGAPVSDDISTLAIDGSGAPVSDGISILAIDGSGAPVSDDIIILAIDGSGGPVADSISVLAIDGSGAPVSDDISILAIDGSGAPVSDDISILAIDGSGAPVSDDIIILAIDGSGGPLADGITLLAIDGSGSLGGNEHSDRKLGDYARLAEIRTYGSEADLHPARGCAPPDSQARLEVHGFPLGLTLESYEFEFGVEPAAFEDCALLVRAPAYLDSANSDYWRVGPYLVPRFALSAFTQNGDTVSIFGSLTEAGSILARAFDTGDQFVPGVSLAVVTGPSIVFGGGYAEIGSTRVYLDALEAGQQMLAGANRLVGYYYPVMEGY